MQRGVHVSSSDDFSLVSIVTCYLQRGSICHSGSFHGRAIDFLSEYCLVLSAPFI